MEEDLESKLIGFGGIGIVMEKEGRKEGKIERMLFSLKIDDINFFLIMP